mmetsp:Transcript_31019/g.72521  ORF Transcript_31019/g.72521 Transcript_31019/m.72521 type:complete len:217 (+) Transcript_31019:1476-2126(+)
MVLRDLESVRTPQPSNERLDHLPLSHDITDSLRYSSLLHRGPPNHRAAIAVPSSELPAPNRGCHSCHCALSRPHRPYTLHGVVSLHSDLPEPHLAVGVPCHHKLLVAVYASVPHADRRTRDIESACTPSEHFTRQHPVGGPHPHPNRRACHHCATLFINRNSHHPSPDTSAAQQHVQCCTALRVPCNHPATSAPADTNAMHLTDRKTRYTFRVPCQ